MICLTRKSLQQEEKLTKELHKKEKSTEEKLINENTFKCWLAFSYQVKYDENALVFELIVWEEKKSIDQLRKLEKLCDFSISFEYNEIKDA